MTGERYTPLPLTPESDMLPRLHTDGWRQCAQKDCPVRLRAGVYCGRHLAKRRMTARPVI